MLRLISDQAVTTKLLCKAPVLIKRGQKMVCNMHEKEAALVLLQRECRTQLLKYKNVLHMNESILTLLREIILEKFKDIQIYILNPSIDDLFENNVYKLEINKTLYFVPLWHGELYFDAISEDKKENKERNGGTVLSSNEYDIIVKCIPDLPQHISIDENNNLYVNVNIPFQTSLLKEKSIPIYLGKKRFDIKTERLLIREKQTLVFKNMGVSLINENDIYSVERKGDVYVKITFV